MDAQTWARVWLAGAKSQGCPDVVTGVGLSLIGSIDKSTIFFLGGRPSLIFTCAGCKISSSL